MGCMKYSKKLGIILTLLVACGENTSSMTITAPTAPTTLPSTGDASTGTTGGETSLVPTSSTTMANAGPVFLSFNTNVSKITEGESVIFTALLTDPDGVEDIIGGSLLSENEAIDYGPFVAAGQVGTYSISLSWAQIEQSASINFENTELSLPLRARFFDQGGNKAVSDAQITLACAGGSACNGSCTNISADGANCGACDHTCSSMTCSESKCGPIWSECFVKTDGFSTCAEVCQSISESCEEAQCGAFTTEYYGTMMECLKQTGEISGVDSCDKVQSWINPVIRCCCSDLN